MTRVSAVLGIVVLASGIAAGCGRTEQQNTGSTESMPMQPPAPEGGTSTAAGNVQVTFQSQPDPPQMGENTFEVTVMSDGQPVTDAEVSAEFFMAAMPSINMPEMKNSVALKHEGAGRYRGTGNVMMSGNWDVTVRVRRGGQEIGSRTLTITAK